MKILESEMLPPWLMPMRGAEARTELSLAEFLPLDFPAFCRILNPARAASGHSLRWKDLADPAVAFTSETQWKDISSQTGDPFLPKLDPVIGGIDRETGAVLAAVLRSHTKTPDSIYFLAWEGYAGLTEMYRSSEAVPGPYGRRLHVVQGSLEDVGRSLSTGMAEVPLWWIPADGSWCVGNDIYARSVYVGGSRSCISDIQAEPRLEELVVPGTQRVIAED